MAAQQQHGGIHDRAQVGFADSATYDKHRPTYTATATQTLLDRTRVAGRKNAVILDLAAGTGKFTEGIVRRDEQYEVIAVEPHDGMREVLAQKHLPGTVVKTGTAEKIPLDDESVDAVICAQAFHWFANKAALKEIHRVLRPHGCLGMIWNIEDYNSPRDYEATTPWEEKARQLTWTFNDNTWRFRHSQWRKVFEDQSKATPMSLIIAKDQYFALPLGEQTENFEIWLEKEKIWERYSTISHIAVLEGEERERTYKTFMDALNSPDVEVNEKGEVAVHGKTHIVWTSKIPEDGRESLTGV